MNKIILLLTLTIFSFLKGFGQYINTSNKDAVDLKKRVLLVCLPEENKHFLAKFGEAYPEMDSLYKIDIKGQGAALKKTMQEYWAYNDSICFVTSKEAKSMMKASPDKFAIMKIGEQVQDVLYVSQFQPIKQVTGWTARGNQFEYNYMRRYNHMMLGITSLEIGTPKTIIKVYLPKISPSEGDFIYAIQQMNYVLTNVGKSEEMAAGKLHKQAKEKLPELKNKTLLLDSYETKGTAEEISKVYPYPFKIVSYATIEDALRKRDTNYVLLQSARCESTNSTFYLSNAGDGTIYGQYVDLTFKYGNIDGNQMSIQIFYPAIQKEHIELFW